MARLDRAFANDISTAIDNHTLEPSYVVRHNINAKWLIYTLADKEIPVKVVNLGAGVKRIILVDQVCPHCKGKGWIK